jgi:hypothetical protein
MAWLEQHPTSGRFKICFRWSGRKLKKTIKAKSQKDADAIRLRFEENIALLERGRLELPPGADIGTFLLSDGKISNKPQPEPIVKPITLTHLRDRYVEVHSNGTLEKTSLETAKMHLRHFERTLGGSFAIGSLSLAHLQNHLTRRSALKGHFGKHLSPATLRKEISTLRAVWNRPVYAERFEQRVHDPRRCSRQGQDVADAADHHARLDRTSCASGPGNNGR